MSEIISEDERANAKLAQLNAVYSKAVDVTLGSVGPNDIEKVFGDIKGDFGASMSGALVQTLGRTRDRLEVNQLTMFSCTPSNVSLGTRASTTI